MKDPRLTIITHALSLARETGSERLFLFLDSAAECRWFLRTKAAGDPSIVLVVPQQLPADFLEAGKKPAQVIRSWSGNQTRFSRIKYAFLQGVLQGFITIESKVICVLGPSGKKHLDTITIHDLAHSWSEEFPFRVDALINNRAFPVITAVIDIALDIGALGREGKSVGTTFVIGDEETVMSTSHQLVFNPFKGYPAKERSITRPEVVESIKELAQLDGAIIISGSGIVEAAGRNLDAERASAKQLRGLGSRHRSAAGMTRKTEAVAVVVSESTGKVTIFDKGRIAATLEPLISRRLV
ncbi:MAG: DNA integrity scanning protein DisA nucleotide-binding domain protein [Thermodesulfovibrionales bacterium]